MSTELGFFSSEVFGTYYLHWALLRDLYKNERCGPGDKLEKSDWFASQDVLFQIAVEMAHVAKLIEVMDYGNSSGGGDHAEFGSSLIGLCQGLGQEQQSLLDALFRDLRADVLKGIELEHGRYLSSIFFWLRLFFRDLGYRYRRIEKELQEKEIAIMAIPQFEALRVICFTSATCALYMNHLALVLFQDKFRVSVQRFRKL